tara:strand:+ start:120 stop:557 length:438 start_codon:yes stop_codon:yes gene_type:complete
MKSEFVGEVLEYFSGDAVRRVFDLTPVDESVAYRSVDELDNPLYVVIHGDAYQEKELDLVSKYRYLRRLGEIRTNDDHVETGQTLVIEDGGDFKSLIFPEDRPIVIAGCWLEVCVRTAYNQLSKRGHDVYIDKDATLSYEDFLRL